MRRAEPKIQMIFEACNGRPIPRYPRAVNGTLRKPDGMPYLSLDDAARKFCMNRDDLRHLWIDVMREFTERFRALFSDDGSSSAPARVDEQNPDLIFHWGGDHYTGPRIECAHCNKKYMALSVSYASRHLRAAHGIEDRDIKHKYIDHGKDPIFPRLVC